MTLFEIIELIKGILAMAALTCGWYLFVLDGAKANRRWQDEFVAKIQRDSMDRANAGQSHNDVIP